jgi:hypothetical protein
METVLTTIENDRRRAVRRSAREHRLVAARLRPGYDVSVIDVSAGGALIESARRLLPNSRVELHLQSERGVAECVRGHVVRCFVSRLRPDAVRYRGAIAFDHRLAW